MGNAENVVFCDGSTRHLNDDIDLAVFAGIVTRAGGLEPRMVDEQPTRFQRFATGSACGHLLMQHSSGRQDDLSAGGSS